MTKAALLTGLTIKDSLSAYTRPLVEGLGRWREGLREMALPADRQNQVIGPDEVPEMSPREIAQPLTGAEKARSSCTRCGRSAGSAGGRWFRIDRKAYCEVCAPSVTQAENQALFLAGSGPVTGNSKPTGRNALARPLGTLPKSSRKGDSYSYQGPLSEPTTSQTDGTPILPTRQTRLVKTTAVHKITLPDDETQGVRLRLPSWSIATGDRRTGLAIRPGLVQAGKEQVKLDMTKFYLVHEDSGTRVVPHVFPDPKAAHALGRLLGQFNWRRPYETISGAERGTMQATIDTYDWVMASARLDARGRKDN